MFWVSSTAASLFRRKSESLTLMSNINFELLGVETKTTFQSDFLSSCNLSTKLSHI